MANSWDESAKPQDDRPAILEAALRALPVAIEVFASDGACVFANPAAREFGRLGPEGSDHETVVWAERALLIERRRFDAERAQYRVGVAIDISDERRLQDDLFQRAYFDDLTRLPNRGFFEEAVGRSIRSDVAPQFAIAVVGFDQFDAVNEFYGRAVGDALLIEAAKRIGGELGEADLAARSSGDEFSLMIASQEAANDVGDKIECILARLKDPFFVNGVEILISASAGLSLFPRHDATLEGLIAKAGAALAQAKRRYKGEARLYDPELAVRAQERARMEQNLRLAVRDRRFVCALQPKVDFRTGALDGLEVLMRWRDENGAARSPGQSIEFALSAGLMNEITHLVFDNVIASLDRIDEAFGSGVRLSFNIAAQQAGDARFMRSFVDRLAASGHAGRFMIELTEEAFLLASQFQLQVAPMLRDVGAKISIDDFGVGYSSLSTLAEIPADEIKVDRSFITSIHQRPRSQSLLRAIESIGEALKTKIVVEGVETEDELRYLRDHTRISVAQGFLFSEPILLDQQPQSNWRISEPARQKARNPDPLRTIEARPA